MRIVRNTTLQGFYISFNTPEGHKDIFLAPKSVIETPDSWSSSVVENLVKRRMATIRYVEDPAPLPPPPPRNYSLERFNKNEKKKSK